MFATKAQRRDLFKGASAAETGVFPLASVDLPVLLDMLNFFLPPTDDGLHMQVGFYEAGRRTMFSMVRMLAHND